MCDIVNGARRPRRNDSMQAHHNQTIPKMNRFSSSDIPVLRLLLILTTVLPVCALAQDGLKPGGRGELPIGTLVASPLDNQVKSQLDKFFTALRTGKTEDAYKELLKESNIARRPEDVQALIAKTNEAIAMYGKLEGAELIRTRFAGKRLVKVTYFSFCKFYPLQWDFYCYNSGPEGWRLIDIKVSNELAEMIGD